SSMAYGADPNSSHSLKANQPSQTSTLGLGERQPTKEEINWANKHMSKNRPIRNNKLAIKRINDELKLKGQPQININSAVPMGKEVSAQVDATSASTTTLSSNTSSTSATVLPSFIDNSTLACFPPIGDQNPLSSCVAFSTTYYQFTHMTGLLRNWDVKNDTTNTKKFSPSWTYNIGNSGADNGMSIYGAYGILSDDGALTWANFPYDNTNYKKWPITSDLWLDAIKYRADQSGNVEISDTAVPRNDDTPVTSATDPDLNLLKNYLNNGYVLSFATYIWSWQFKDIGNDPLTTVDDPFVGKKICYARATNNSYDGRHVMTVVGYNDNIWTDINGNGVVDRDKGEMGAFKVANSWGANSNNNMDNGFYWVAYDALNRVSSVPGAPTFAHRSVAFNNDPNNESSEHNDLYWITAKESYNPSLSAVFTVSHSKRSQMKIEVGYSDTNTTTPIKTQSFYALTYAGGGFQRNYIKNNYYDYSGDYAFDGTGNGAGNTICNGNFTVDFSDMVKSDNLATGATRRWYLNVMDGSTDGKSLTVTGFSLINSSGTVLASTGNISRTVDGNTTTIYLDYALGTPQSVWTNKANAPVYRADSASASYNNEIYIAGGVDDNFTAQNTLWSYNPANGAWTGKANMNESRSEAGAATLLNKIYVAGGFNNSSLNSIEEYNPSNNTWVSKTNMPTARNCLGVASANGKIYAIGGLCNGATVNTVEEYDPTTDTWKTKASMPTARHSFGIVSYNGKIYVIGGTTAAGTKCSTVEAYDPLNDIWDTTKASMPTSRDGLACTAYNGKIYAVGGTQAGGVISGKTEVFDPSTNVWTTSANLNNARALLNAVCANNKLYTFLGIDATSNLSNKVEEYAP
ncbi:MAG: kelch repeat-containing protein, partial [Bacillota bacterium]|nr:kelch repeat-containing protein [Bacillota bacterium]